jgi:presenilin 1
VRKLIDKTVELNICELCGKEASFMCAQCGPSVKYCSEACQIEDWPRHQQTCGDNNLGGHQGANSAEERAAADQLSMSHRRTVSRYGAAQVINRRQSVRMSRQMTNRRSLASLPSINDDDEMTEEEKAEELRFYVKQIYLIIKPVLGCILLSILWVKISLSSSDYK